MRTTDKNAIVRIAHRIFAYWNTPSSRFLFYFYKPSITFYFWLCSSSPLYLLHYPPVTVTVSSRNIARVRTFPQSIASSQYARGSVSESSNLNIPTKKKKNSPPKNPLLSPILTFQVILWQCLPIKAIGQPLPWLNTSASHQWSLHSFPQLTSETSELPFSVLLNLELSAYLVLYLVSQLLLPKPSLSPVSLLLSSSIENGV